MEYTHRNIPQLILREAFTEYASPNAKVCRLEQSGEVIRLKRGMYITSPQYSGMLLSQELIANHLYGPSYVSYETALSYYGIIPERVTIVRSATIKRGRVFNNDIGEFEYIAVPTDYFSIGVRIEIVENEYAFLIATPEKAICDLILATSGLRLQSVKAVREYLYKNMRIEEESVLQMDNTIIEECIQYGRKRNDLTNLAKFIRDEQSI